MAHRPALVLALASFGLLVAANLLHRAEGVIEAKALEKLIKGVRDSKAPTVEEVVAGFKDYVCLYKEQSDLTSTLGLEANPNDISSGSESAYERVADILAKSEIKILFDGIFSSIPGYSNYINGPEDMAMTAKQTSAIQKAINELKAQSIYVS